MQTAHTRPRQYPPPGTRGSFVWSLELPSAPTCSASQNFLSSQGEIRVLVRRTTREPIEATCGFLATSREFGATSTNYPGGARANTCVVAGGADGVGCDAMQHDVSATSFSRPCRCRSWRPMPLAVRLGPRLAGHQIDACF